MRHALGDAYCDDWYISDHNFVANTLLRQVSLACSDSTMHASVMRACACAQMQDGSIIIMQRCSGARQGVRRSRLLFVQQALQPVQQALMFEPKRGRRAVMRAAVLRTRRVTQGPTTGQSWSRSIINFIMITALYI